MDIIKILNEGGYKTEEGAENVRLKVLELAHSSPTGQPLYSGYRVFPDGTKCPGCSDCTGAAE